MNTPPKRLYLNKVAYRSDFGRSSRSAGNDNAVSQIRYLHGRWVRLESCRKALVWQKRYLQRVLAGYAELERRLRLTAPAPPVRGLKRFKCVAWAAVAAARMAFLVRRREQARALAAAALLRPARPERPERPGTPVLSPPTREAGAGAGAGAGPAASASAVRRALLRTRPLKLPYSPSVPESIQRLPFGVNSPHDDHLVISSPRGDAAVYLHKLDSVSRRLSARDAVRDTP
ncbi:unnamed protein product [Euphydryas editha]|uniref:Pericentrin/AKAP-450 centrosomal targeting domain-containing protein n=1 Tax=Euphydryas editha TaxID=104508 RepID=A0AAU9U6G8_EUPED|nr:unnamed protein product [Euphydryas editha]